MIFSFIALHTQAETDDYRIVSELVISGQENDSRCLTIEILSDERIEETEVFAVEIGSNDTAARFLNDTVVIRIGDANFGRKM